ncbi:MAG: glycosyltransferase family 4 protein [Methylobacter sp.]
MKRKFICVTLNDFSIDDGSTVRMRGIVNALADAGETVYFFSNCTDIAQFSTGIQHIYLDVIFSKKQKQFLQICLALMPFSIVKALFHKIINELGDKLNQCVFNPEDKIIFFDYLDNSIAFLLYHASAIPEYINDIHGIAPLEFKLKKCNSINAKAINFIKYHLSNKLDAKVVASAKGLIFVSRAMEQYFINEYPFIANKRNFIVRDGVAKVLCHQQVSLVEAMQLKSRYQLEHSDRVIFFAGEFKDLGGVLDLINAFLSIVNKYPVLKLILVGDGEVLFSAKQLANQSAYADKIFFVGRIPYNQLKSHQMLADIIVCPDKQHPFSEMVPHIKYFDSLASAKVVINGRFQCIEELNPDEFLSINFEPSNSESLAHVIVYCLNNLEQLTLKYAHNPEYVCNKLTYDEAVKSFCIF